LLRAGGLTTQLDGTGNPSRLIAVEKVGQAQRPAALRRFHAALRARHDG
jgi:hypothetical protein